MIFPDVGTDWNTLPCSGTGGSPRHSRHRPADHHNVEYFMNQFKNVAKQLEHDSDVQAGDHVIETEIVSSNLMIAATTPNRKCGEEDLGS